MVVIALSELNMARIIPLVNHDQEVRLPTELTSNQIEFNTLTLCQWKIITSKGIMKTFQELHHSAKNRCLDPGHLQYTT